MNATTQGVYRNHGNDPQAQTCCTGSYHIITGLSRGNRAETFVALQRLYRAGFICEMT